MLLLDIDVCELSYGYSIRIRSNPRHKSVVSDFTSYFINTIMDNILKLLYRR